MAFSNLFEKQNKEKQKKLKIKTAKKILIGTAVGSLSGLVGGLLLSPKSGKENRECIVNSSKEFTNNIKQRTTDFKGIIDNKVTYTKDHVSDAKIKIYQYINEKNTSKVICETKDKLTNNEDLTSL